MVKTMKYRKNISNATKHMGGGNIDEAIKPMISTFNWISRMYCSDTILAKFGSPAIKTFIGSVPENDTLNALIKSLGINATMKELIQTCLETLKCKDIKTIITILPKLVAFDKIQEFLQTPDEAAKKATEFYLTIKVIVDDINNQELICRIFNSLKSKKYVTDDHIKIFTAFIGGDPKLCETIDLGEPDVPNAGSEESEGSNPTFSERIKNMSSSLFGKQSNDNDENTNDKRCGEKQILKKSFIIGDYCAPKPTTTVVEAAKPEKASQSSDTPVVTTETPAKPVIEASMPEQAPPPDNVSANMKGGKREKSKRVKQSKKNKKSKSKKSKRSNK